jgi:AraC family transcriptional regulator
MADLDVRIVTLEPMRVASARAVSETPERDAWERLCTWAEPQGLLEDNEKHPIFGFNNPNPSPERREYGYELWIQVDPETQADGEIKVKDFAGGRFAVTSCKLMDDPRGNTAEIWLKLWKWVQSSEYRWRKTHELEKSLDPRAPMEEMVLDLYLPIED